MLLKCPEAAAQQSQGISISAWDSVFWTSSLQFCLTPCETISGYASFSPLPGIDYIVSKIAQTKKTLSKPAHSQRSPSRFSTFLWQEHATFVLSWQSDGRYFCLISVFELNRGRYFLIQLHPVRASMCVTQWEIWESIKKCALMASQKDSRAFVAWKQKA